MIGYWYAYMPRGERLGYSIPGLGMESGGYIYHNGGITYMPWSLDQFSIRKRYGLHKDTEAKRITALLFKDFPPKTGPATAVVRLGAAFINPEGDIYPCRSFEHSVLARRINIVLETGDRSHIFGDETLMKRGWVRLQYNGLHCYGDLTQRQIDALWDIAVAAKGTQPKMATAINERLRRE